MATYFQSTISYRKEIGGKLQKVTEQYLFDALSYTEAEARTIEECTPQTSEDSFSIANLVKPHIAELFLTDNLSADKFYKITVCFITIDEKTAQEKRTKSIILVQAQDFDDAVRRFKEGMKGTMADYEIYSVTETAILEYFPAKPIEHTDE